MIPGKSAAAFQLSVRTLRESNDKLYFWTLTFERVTSDRWAMYMWKLFNQWLSRWCDGLVRGVRVIEFHETHGAHFHFIINRRIPVQIVRRISARWGFGRNHAEPCWDGAAAYLSKYMSKNYRKQFPTGMRRWACIGGFKGSRVRDLQLVSTGSRNTKRLFGGRRVHIAGIQMAYLLTDFFGPLKEWPSKFVRRCQCAGGIIEDIHEDEEWWRQWKRDSRGYTQFEIDLFNEVTQRNLTNQDVREVLTGYPHSVESVL